MSDDVIYYAELEAGARYLASMTSDPDERAEHLKMASVYRDRACHVSGAPRSTTTH